MPVPTGSVRVEVPATAGACKEMAPLVDPPKASRPLSDTVVVPLNVKLAEPPKNPLLLYWI